VKIGCNSRRAHKGSFRAYAASEMHPTIVVIYVSIKTNTTKCKQPIGSAVAWSPCTPVSWLRDVKVQLHTQALICGRWWNGRREGRLQ
jgi:hypothetical protein